jgi:hypothetical protein
LIWDSCFPFSVYSFGARNPRLGFPTLFATLEPVFSNCLTLSDHTFSLRFISASRGPRSPILGLLYLLDACETFRFISRLVLLFRPVSVYIHTFGRVSYSISMPSEAQLGPRIVVRQFDFVSSSRCIFCYQASGCSAFNF